LQSQDYYVYTTRNINNYSINEFKISLSYETWDCFFGLNNNSDVDTLFNSFLNKYLRIFHHHFPQRKLIKRHNHTSWITPGIKISCKHKRFIYLCTINSDDISLKKYYKKYCGILANVIKEAKKCTYNNLINKSTNKIKTTWNIIKTETIITLYYYRSRITAWICATSVQWYKYCYMVWSLDLLQGPNKCSAFTNMIIHVCSGILFRIYSCLHTLYILLYTCMQHCSSLMYEYVTSRESEVVKTVLLQYLIAKDNSL
jgi:hypothetical protein